MKTTRNKTLATTAIVLILFVSAIMVGAPLVNAQLPRRNTMGFLSVNPYTLGLGQTLLVNLWTFPSPANRAFRWVGIGYKDVTITFTKPDGSIDSFMPVHGSGVFPPGVTETLGGMWFHYVPDQIGTWTVTFSQPEQVIGEPPDDIIFEAASPPQITTFTVQADPVQIGETPRALPGPNEYWDRPISGEHREWHVLGGNWLSRRNDPISQGNFNPYTTGPNSPHIVWKTQVADGGLVGGKWGSISYPAGSFGGGGWGNPIIMNGRVFYNQPGGKFIARDLSTGELIYEAEGTVSFGQIIRAASRTTTILEETESGLTREYLWRTSGSTWTRYDAYSGTSTLALTGVPSGMRGATVFGDIIYTLRQGPWNNTIFERRDYNRLIKLDLTKRGSTFTDKIVYNVTLKQPDGRGPGEGNRGSSLSLTADGTVIQVLTAGEDMFYGFDSTTGQQIYTKDIGYMYMIFAAHLGPNDTVLGPESESWPGKYHSYDLKTGDENWVVEFDVYPWAIATRPYGYGYGMVFFMGYDGHVTAVDEDTGVKLWTFYTGDTTETPYGTWVPFLGPCIGGGKYYIGTSEHTPTQPRVRGAKMFCLNAFTGDEIWRINDGLQPNGLADGYLIASSEYTGIGYAFGKGKTETTVMASPKVTAKGASVLIEGTVMDMSPAQAGTPAVSDESMGPWMEYLHMQKPVPMDVSGVWVRITAVASDGTATEITTVQSDMAGLYKKMWTPPAAGEYTIIADFGGSESYWPSYAETAIGVTAGPSAAPAFKPLSGPVEAQAATTDLILVITAIAAVAVIAAVAFVLRRRK